MGRVKNGLKMAKYCFAWRLFKMDSSLHVDKHVSHFTGQAKQLLSVSFLMRITVSLLVYKTSNDLSE